MMQDRLSSAGAVMISQDRISWAEDATPCLVRRGKKVYSRYSRGGIYLMVRTGTNTEVF